MIKDATYYHWDYELIVDLKQTYYINQKFIGVLRLKGLGMNHHGLLYLAPDLYQALKVLYHYRNSVSYHQMHLVDLFLIHLDRILFDLENKEKIPRTDRTRWTKKVVFE